MLSELRHRRLDADEETPAEIVVVRTVRRNLPERGDRRPDRRNERRLLVKQVRNTEQEADVLVHLELGRNAVIANHRQLVDWAIWAAAECERGSCCQTVLRSQVASAEVD